MKINASDHLYSSQVESFFRNERFTAPRAIGMQSEVTQEIINHKSQSLRSDLAGYDLRSITPNELSKLAVKLFESGEISDNAASEFISATREQGEQAGKDVKFDAIDYFEFKFSHIKKHGKNDPTLAMAQKISSDALHTIYNIDDFIRGSRESLRINTRV